MFVKFNTLRPPFQGNPKLWQALNYAIDKKLIIDSLWSGMGAVANCQPLSPAYFGDNPDLKPYPYDPAKAKALLAEPASRAGLAVRLKRTHARLIKAPHNPQTTAATVEDLGGKECEGKREWSRW